MEKILVLIFLAVGIGLSMKGVWDLVLLKRTENWPTAFATIKTSSIKIENKTYLDKERDRVIEKDKFWPNIEYEYFVGSTHYSSSRVTSGTEYGYDKKSEAKKVVDKYKAGKEYQIRYNPNNPEYSILEIAPKEKELAMIIFGCLFSLFAIAFWFISKLFK